MTTLEQLQRGRDRIAANWCQQSLARPVVTPEQDGAVRWVCYAVCALGGLLSDGNILAAASGSGDAPQRELKFQGDAIRALADAARQIWPGQFEQMDAEAVIITVNDGFATDSSEVLAMYDRAIANLQAVDAVGVVARETELATAGD